MTRRAWLGMAGASFGVAALPIARAGEKRYDAVIYGATPSGVMAAVAAARQGLNVAMVAAGPLGGMCAQGLGFTDAARPDLYGGLTLKFFQNVGKAYGDKHPVYVFEPHVAEAVFEDMLDEAGVVLINGYLGHVSMSGRRIDALRCTNGKAVYGRYFADASYEGDLMAAAGCRYIVGRESQTAHGESFAGFNYHETVYHAKFRDSHGNLIDGVKPFPSDQKQGSADSAVPAYTFRLCLSDDPKNMVRFVMPVNYDPSDFLLAGSLLTDYPRFAPGKLPNHKFDMNGDHIGASWDWPVGTYQRRAHIWHDHYDYMAGLLYFYANDPSVPKHLQDEVNRYGLAKDEFVDSGNWPKQLYVREAKRLIGRTILTQQDVQESKRQSAPIGIGTHAFDSHATQLLATGAETVLFEGEINPHKMAEVNPYQIPFQILVPREVDNLVVSVCVSATHVAYQSLRMEPQYMMMGEAAGCALGLAQPHAEPVIHVEGDISAKLASYGVILDPDA